MYWSHNLNTAIEIVSDVPWFKRAYDIYYLDGVYRVMQTFKKKENTIVSTCHKEAVRNKCKQDKIRSYLPRSSNKQLSKERTVQIPNLHLNWDDIVSSS